MKVKMNEKIKMLRTENQLTQAEMAERLNLSVQAYGSIERGETRILNENFELLLTEFNLDLLEFLSIGENGIICLITKNHVEKSNFVLKADNNTITTNNTIDHDFQHHLEKLEIENQHKNETIVLLKQALADKESIIKHLKQEILAIQNQ